MKNDSQEKVTFRIPLLPLAHHSRTTSDVCNGRGKWIHYQYCLGASPMPVKSLGRVLMVGHGFLGELDGTKCLSARHFWSQLTRGVSPPSLTPSPSNHKNLTNLINRPKISHFPRTKNIRMEMYSLTDCLKIS